MLLIAGLGNPGGQYGGHRHNVGFMAADRIASRLAFSGWSGKFNGEISEGRIGTEKALLLKPQTYMNESGQAVGQAMRFYKLQPSDLIVLYDELDLAPGKVRVKTGGGAGGHNGIRSIDAHIGKDYRRVRIGIGHPGHKALVTKHVLGDFAKADRDWLDPLLDAIADAMPDLAANNASQFMNKVALANPDRAGADDKTAAATSEKPAGGSGKAKGQSHIRQARKPSLADRPEPKGPMADMLKKLIGK